MTSSRGYTELFKITYSGNVSDLNKQLAELAGVTNISGTEQSHRDVDKTLDYDITYDSHETDRETVAKSAEDINGVTEVTIG